MSRQNLDYWDLIIDKENHLTKDKRQKLGSFYTPKSIVKMMVEKFKHETCNNVLDPCCGYGNLLIGMLAYFPDLQEEQVYGVDIDPEAIRRAKEILPNANYQVGNVLEDDLTDDRFWQKPVYQRFSDYLAGLPPEKAPTKFHKRPKPNGFVF
jgi:type I restriction-modification system DNA methylase subunit